MHRQIDRFVSCISSAMSGCLLYSTDHPAVVDQSKKALGLMQHLFIDGSLVIIIDDDELLINGMPVELNTPHAKKVFLKMRQKRISKIVVRRGIGTEELKQFFSELTSSRSLSGSYSNILVNCSKDKPFGETPLPVQDKKDDVMKMKEIYQGIAVYKTIDTRAVDALIGGFITAIRKDKNILKMLIPASSGEDYTFIHNVNVAMLSIFQGALLGFGSDALYEIGFASLLHDIGKNLIPADILGKQSPLDDREWQIMKMHPVYGASLLTGLTRVPDLAVIVALEHHLKYDGTGYPETKRRSKKQHAVSQIVAISDFFEAMSADLPHRKPLPTPTVLALLREASGREFNPLLADTFIYAFRG